MVARRDRGHVGADLLDDARALVAEHRGQRHRVPLVAHDQVGVADPGGGDPHQHLVGPHRPELDLLEGEGGALVRRHGRRDPHGAGSSAAGSSETTSSRPTGRSWIPNRSVIVPHTPRGRKIANTIAVAPSPVR